MSDLFALRNGHNVKRMWLGLHNVFGILSLPSPVIIALTAVVFASHDQFYDLQSATFARSRSALPEEAAGPPARERSAPLAPAEIIRRIEAQAPGFTVRAVNYEREPKPHPCACAGQRSTPRAARADSRDGRGRCLYRRTHRSRLHAGRQDG